jgi:hypothetical protein
MPTCKAVAAAVQRSIQHSVVLGSTKESELEASPGHLPGRRLLRPQTLKLGQGQAQAQAQALTPLENLRRLQALVKAQAQAQGQAQ